MEWDGRQPFPYSVRHPQYDTGPKGPRSLCAAIPLPEPSAHRGWGGARARSRRGHSMAVLIVDDSRDEQDLLRNRLQAAGYEALLVADSAETALAIVGQVEGEQR